MQTIKIEDYEDKKTKTGNRYTKFKTSEGYMACFDKDVAEAAKKYEGKEVNVEIKQQGDFKNLTKVYENGSEQQTEASPQTPKETMQSIASDNAIDLLRQILAELKSLKQ